jgi:hypothetical protein
MVGLGDEAMQPRKLSPAMIAGVLVVLRIAQFATSTG